MTQTMTNPLLLKPIRHLRGEPTPEALLLLFKQTHGKGRKKLARKVFGPAKRGPKSCDRIRLTIVIEHRRK